VFNAVTGEWSVQQKFSFNGWKQEDGFFSQNPGVAEVVLKNIPEAVARLGLVDPDQKSQFYGTGFVFFFFFVYFTS
jgi:hypothetical protein